VKHLAEHEIKDNYGWVYVKLNPENINDTSSLTLVTDEKWIFETLTREELEELDKEIEGNGYQSVIEYQDIYTQFQYKYKNVSIEKAIKGLWRDILDYGEYDCLQS
jgi:hypothetical protein